MWQFFPHGSAAASLKGTFQRRAVSSHEFKAQNFTWGTRTPESRLILTHKRPLEVQSSQRAGLSQLCPPQGQGLDRETPATQQPRQQRLRAAGNQMNK